MDRLKTLTSETPSDIDKNIDEILTILSDLKEGEDKDVLTLEKWQQIFSVAGRKRKLTESSRCLDIIINNLYGTAKTKALNLSGFVWITDSVVKKIGDALEVADSFEEVISVNVDMCRNISFECLLDSVLSKTVNLTQFSCKFCTKFLCSKIEKMCAYPTLLDTVDLSGLNDLSDSFFARFFYVFPSIKVLKLNYVSNISQNIFKIASEKLPSLKCLEVSFCNPQISIDNGMVRYFQNFTMLEKLSIAGSKLSFLTLEKIVQGIHSLIHLNLLDCEFKLDDIKHAVPESFIRIKSIVIGGKTVTDELFSFIPRFFPNLTELDMSGCTKVSSKVVLPALNSTMFLQTIYAGGKLNHVDKQVFLRLKESHPSLVVYTTKKLN